MNVLLCLLLTVGQADSSDASARVPILSDLAEDEDNELDDFVEESEYEGWEEVGYRPARRSYLVWVFEALGIGYVFLLSLSGSLVLLGAVLMVALVKRPAVIATYLVILPLPLLIGLYGALDGMIDMIDAFSVISMRFVTPKPSEIFGGISTVVFCPLVGFLVNAPAYFVMALGLPLRAIFARGEGR